jgi:hypothetical protein
VNARMATVAKRIFFMVITSCRVSMIEQWAIDPDDKGSCDVGFGSFPIELQSFCCEERGGIGFRAPGVSVGIGGDRY